MVEAVVIVGLVLLSLLSLAIFAGALFWGWIMREEAILLLEARQRELRDRTRSHKRKHPKARKRRGASTLARQIRSGKAPP